VKSIGTGIIGSSQEESTRRILVEWEEKGVYFLPSNGGKAIGWINESRSPIVLHILKAALGDSSWDIPSEDKMEHVKKLSCIFEKEETKLINNNATTNNTNNMYELGSDATRCVTKALNILV